MSPRRTDATEEQTGGGNTITRFLMVFYYCSALYTVRFGGANAGYVHKISPINMHAQIDQGEDKPLPATFGEQRIRHIEIQHTLSIFFPMEDFEEPSGFPH